MRELAELAERLSQQVPAAPQVETGYPAEVIVDSARERQAGLIVMATHGRSGLRRWTLGSVADKVLHASSIPLLLVRAEPGHVSARSGAGEHR